jgi:hypothetical protein
MLLNLIHFLIFVFAPILLIVGGFTYLFLMQVKYRINRTVKGAAEFDQYLKDQQTNETNK